MLKSKGILISWLKVSGNVFQVCRIRKDGVQGFYFKKITNLYDRLGKHLQVCLNAGIVPPWMTKLGQC